jgi:hypothetical protein
MLIWQGRGVAVFVFAFFGVLLAGVLALAVLGESFYRNESQTWIGIGLVLGGALCLWFGRRWNDPANDRSLVDPQTGEQVVLRNRHTFWFLPMEWWGMAGILLGVALFILGILG